MPDPASYGIKTFVNGKALYRSFDHMKTYIDGSISSAITAHNADAAHRHLPSVPTTNPPTNAFSYLTNSSTPAWSTMPTATGYTDSSNGKLATAGAVKSAYDTLNTNLTNTNEITIFTNSHGLTCRYKHIGKVNQLEFSGKLTENLAAANAYQLCAASVFSNNSIPFQNYISCEEFNRGIHLRFYTNA